MPKKRFGTINTHRDFSSNRKAEEYTMESNEATATRIKAGQDRSNAVIKGTASDLTLANLLKTELSKLFAPLFDSPILVNPQTGMYFFYLTISNEKLAGRLQTSTGETDT